MLYQPSFASDQAKFSASFTRQASTLLLDAIQYDRLDPVHTPEKCTDLLFGLNLIRRVSPADVWDDTIQYIRTHPAFERLLRYPVNARAFEKPRGYAGDAVLIDFLYGIEDLNVDDPWIEAVYEWSKSMPSFAAVNARREAIARAVEETVRAKPGAAILSVACGHVREWELIGHAAQANIGRFVCLDQDAESLATVKRDYVGAPVELVEGSVRDILRNKLPFAGQFDFIYTAGLYDYLEERVARALTAKLADMLSPNGRLLVANFATTLPDVGYMEALMDWKLVYRTEDEMRALAPPMSGKHEIATHRMASPNLVWLDIKRG